MRKQTICLIFFLLIFCGSICQISPNNTGITVSMKGYVINMGGLNIFQPCEDSTINFLESLDNRSFNLWCDRNDLYFNAIEKIGDSILVNGYDSSDKKAYVMNVSYFYCTLSIELLLLDKDFEIFKEPSYEFYYDKKKYNLRYFYIRNRVLKIVPSTSPNLLLMYKFYDDRNYAIPKWLENLTKQQKIVSTNTKNIRKKNSKQERTK